MGQTTYNNLAVKTNLTVAGADAVTKVANVAALVAMSPKQDGQLVETLGYYSAGDGGGAQYYWDSTSSDPTNRVVIASNGGRFKIIPNGKISSAQWGIASGSDNLDVIQDWVNYTATNNLEATLSSGTYGLTNSLVIPSNARIVGSYNSVFERKGVAAQTNNLVYAALRTAYAFNPYVSNGGYTNAAVPSLVTNVTLSGFRLKTANGWFSSFGIAAFGADNWLFENLTIDTMTNHWAITYWGNNIRTIGCVINNSGDIYQDGLHIIGGDQFTFNGNIVYSGDDSFALTIPTRAVQDISNVTISGNIAKSSHAHAIRLAIENPSSTNLIKNIVVTGMSGAAGLKKNALVRFESISTNITKGITNVLLSDIALDSGGLSGHGGTPQGAAYGYHIHNSDNVVLSGIHIPQTPYWPIYIKNCGSVLLLNVIADGAEYTSLNATVFAEDSDLVQIIGGQYKNTSILDADVIWPKNIKLFSATGVFIENQKTNRACVTFVITAPTTAILSGCVLTNRLGFALTSYANPSQLAIVGSMFGSAQGVSWAGGTPPAGAVISANLGLSGGGSTSSTQYDVFTSSGTYMGSYGTKSSRIYMVSTNGAFVLAQDFTDGTTKTVRLSGQPYNSANNPIAIAVAQDSGSFPTLTVGGGSALMSGARMIDLQIASSDYAAGTTRGRMTTAGLRIEPGGMSGNPAGALDVVSTTSGFIPPRMTQAQRNAIASPVNGMQVFCTDCIATDGSTGVSQTYSSTSWRNQY